MPRPHVIFYESRGLKLKGYFYEPSGAGRFPAYLWNHGSEKNPAMGRRMAQFWLAKGFVYFVPVRSGHGDNPGPYIMDEQRTRPRETVRLHEQANDDVIAAYRWLRRQPKVDPAHILVGGGSFGGIQTLLTAERDAREHLGIRCFIAMSPAAMSWKNPAWAPRLSTAVRNARAPLFLVQARNDYDLGPTEVLGPIVDAKGFPNRHQLFPIHGDPNNHRAGHGGFFGDPSAWFDDVWRYLHDCGEVS